MSKYYIYGSNNQAYHALIHNSIMAKSMMSEDFRSDTAAYLSKDYIFITKLKASEEVRIAGIAEAYYSVALEIEVNDEASHIPAYFVSKNEDGTVALSEAKLLSDCDQTDKCLGAFICGEIPITYLSGIIFDDDSHMQTFDKSSNDLWFPKELKRTWEESLVAEDLTLEVLKEAAEKIDAVLTAEESESIKKLVARRNRVKAAVYYGIEATGEWNIGCIRANVDAELINYLDKNDEIIKEIHEAFEKLGDKYADQYEKFLSVKDAVLDKEPSTDINRQLFRHIVSGILDNAPVRTKLSEEVLNKVAGGLADLAKDEGQELLKALKTVSDFLHSNMDPDEALLSLGKYDALRAFMLFLDQQETADFLRRAAKKLSQNERRYAYIMYGTLNGMSEVERGFKENRNLEYRIEEKILEQYPDKKLINELPARENCSFLQGYESASLTGIVPNITVWYDCELSHEMFLSITDKNILEKIYQAMAKSVKDDPIPEEDVYAFKTPVVITVNEGEKTLQTFEITRKKDAKDFGKQIEKTLKSLKEVFNVEGFKKYLKDKKRYQKFYRKNADLIQECCRKAE